MGADDRIVKAAIDKHDELADSLFVGGHDALNRGDHFADPFTYGRWRIRRQLDAHLPLEGEGMRLLDIGCGIGEELGICKARGFDVKGLEPSAEMRRLATERHPDVARDIVEGSIYDIPLEDNEFDYVLSIEVVRYLEDFPRAASEVARILRPGGRWLFTATPPTNWSLGPVLNRLRCAGIPLPGLQKLRMFWHSARYLGSELDDVGLSVAALAPLYYVDLTAMVLKDTIPAASSAWMRLWHPFWALLERSRWAAWGAGYYFVVAEAGEKSAGGD